MGDPKWKTHSRLVYRHLVEGVRVSGRLSDNLISEGLLDYEKASIIDKVQPNTEEQKARCMVQLLSKEPKSYDRFCSVLRKVGYKDLANKLRPRGAKSSPKGMGYICMCCLLSVLPTAPTSRASKVGTQRLSLPWKRCKNWRHWWREQLELTSIIFTWTEDRYLDTQDPRLRRHDWYDVTITIWHCYRVLARQKYRLHP